MLTQKEAQAVAHQAINSPNPSWPDRPEMVITSCESRSQGWLFYYQSEKYLRSGAISDALAGNGPVLVSRHDGAYVHVGTAAPIAEAIAQAEQNILGKKSELGK